MREMTKEDFEALNTARELMREQEPAPGKVSRMMGKVRKDAPTPMGDALPKVANRKQRRAIAASLRKYVKGLT